ncbi:MAG TPA: FkbM family methyltransferase, partial [Microvirga sp.]|nr:FkbM family methyltransferase [Microvirga sp.]
SFKVHKKPINVLSDYLLGYGKYPQKIEVHTRLGEIDLALFSRDDLITVNEIFCRNDYPTEDEDKIIVDFGSNIGISAAYFMTQAPHSYTYLFEPLPMNVSRLRDNLKPFDGRFTIHECAVWLANGTVEFGWEDTGRYGGIGLKKDHSIVVETVDSNEILRKVIDSHGRIDILKIDVESFERELVERIPDDVAQRINRIYVEFKFENNPLSRTHRLSQYGSVTHFVRA